MPDPHYGGNIQPGLDVEEHEHILKAKIVTFGPTSFYSQSSLISGYSFYAFAPPGSNPTTANFKIQRETLNTGEVLFAGGAPTFVHTWSGASLASISYS